VEVREDGRGLVLEFLYSLSNVGIGFGEVLDLHVNRGSPLSILLVFSWKPQEGVMQVPFVFLKSTEFLPAEFLFQLYRESTSLGKAL
jgi:hypothetical protein